MTGQLSFSNIGETKRSNKYRIGNKMYIDSGTRFGLLIVVKRLGSNMEGKTIFLCKCDCGNDRIVTGHALKRGTIRSCGCTNPNKNRIGGNREFNQSFSGYKQGAKRRGLSFELSPDDVKRMFNGECFYCGAIPSMGKNGYTRNGIDRIDSEKGYTLDNCVSCCTECNFLKSDTPYQEFIDRINAIANHMRGE